MGLSWDELDECSMIFHDFAGLVFGFFLEKARQFQDLKNVSIKRGHERGSPMNPENSELRNSKLICELKILP